MSELCGLIFTMMCRITEMGNLKIGGKYVMFSAIESVFYNEELQKMELRTISGDVLHSVACDAQKGEAIIENVLRMVCEMI